MSFTYCFGRANTKTKQTITLLRVILTMTCQLFVCMDGGDRSILPWSWALWFWILLVGPRVWDCYFDVKEFVSGCRQGLQLASKSAALSPGFPVGCVFVAVCF